MIEEPVFILSTGRTGTRSLAMYLNGIHEPYPRRTREIFFCNLLGECSIDYVELVLKETRDSLIQTAHKHGRTYIESNPFLSPFPLTLFDLYPDAHFIHITRDGRDVARSGVSRPDHPDDRWDEAMVNFWDVRFPNLYWSGVDNLSKHAFRWHLLDDNLRRLLLHIEEEGASVLRYRFEDLFNEPYDEFREIIKLTDVDQSTRIMKHGTKHNNTTEYKIPHWTEWSEQQKANFEYVTDFYNIDQYGYSWDGWKGGGI